MSSQLKNINALRNVSVPLYANYYHPLKSVTNLETFGNQQWYPSQPSREFYLPEAQSYRPTFHPGYHQPQNLLNNNYQVSKKTVENENDISHTCTRSIYDSIKCTSGLKCIHINIHSIVHKVDELRHLALRCNVDCISVNESWLDNSVTDSELKIDNFCIYRNDRNRHGGGVLLYIRASLRPSQLNILCETESIWVKIKPGSKRSFIIGSLYRPPCANSGYHNSILNDLEKVTSHNTDSSHGRFQL